MIFTKIISFLIVAAVIVGIWLIPSIIAFKRRHKLKWLVLIVSLLSPLGWIGGLIWAIVGEADG